jgi:hypothetical protein
MKTKISFYLIAFFLFISLASFAQNKTVKANIKVFGNCGMCKERIETSLDHKGIKQAIWDVKKKELAVVYVSSKITEQQIHELVAAAGHDTDKVKAKDETYSDLPFCCLYRDHDHSGMKDNEKHH